MSTHDARAKALTEDIRALLNTLNKIAQRDDPRDYGLPRSLWPQMEQEVSRFFTTALLAVERETWEQAAQEFTSHWVAIMQQDARYDFVSACRAQGQGAGDE